MHILRCETCKSFGLSNNCDCGATRTRVIPPRFSPEDKYAKYRRQAKFENDKEE